MILPAARRSLGLREGLSHALLTSRPISNRWLDRSSGCRRLRIALNSKTQPVYLREWPLRVSLVDLLSASRNRMNASFCCHWLRGGPSGEGGPLHVMHFDAAGRSRWTVKIAAASDKGGDRVESVSIGGNRTLLVANIDTFWTSTWSAYQIVGVGDARDNTSLGRDAGEAGEDGHEVCWEYDVGGRVGEGGSGREEGWYWNSHRGGCGRYCGCCARIAVVLAGGLSVFYQRGGA